MLPFLLEEEDLYFFSVFGKGVPSHLIKKACLIFYNEEMVGQIGDTWRIQLPYLAFLVRDLVNFKLTEVVRPHWKVANKDLLMDICRTNSVALINGPVMYTSL